jgi:hypothetical protein
MVYLCLLLQYLPLCCSQEACSIIVLYLQLPDISLVVDLPMLYLHHFSQYQPLYISSVAGPSSPIKPSQIQIVLLPQLHNICTHILAQPPNTKQYKHKAHFLASKRAPTVYRPGSHSCCKWERREMNLVTFTISCHGGLRHLECLSSHLDFAALVILILITALMARTYFVLLPLKIDLLLYVS